MTKTLHFKKGNMAALLQKFCPISHNQVLYTKL